MTTNASTDVDRSEVPSQIYLPAMARGATAGPIERFVTALYAQHRRLTQRLE